jgi:tetratricopeptide (TPR) repeat protein
MTILKSTSVFLAGVLALGLLLPAGPARGDDGAWSPSWGRFSLAGEVKASCQHQGALVAGGNFTSAGFAILNRVARWDVDHWEPLGDGFGQGEVRQLVSYGDLLVAVGTFETSGASTVGNVAVGDGQTWSPLGEVALGSNVMGAAVYRDEIIIYGSFTDLGAQGVSYIARYDGNGWQPLGAGVDGQVLSVCDLEAQLLVTGGFTTAGGHATEQAAVWGGIAWSPVGMVMPGLPPLDMVYGPAGVFGVNWTNQAYKATNDLSEWVPIGTEVTGILTCLEMVGDTVYVGGSFSGGGPISCNNIAVLEQDTLNRFQDIVVVPCRRDGRAAGSAPDQQRRCRDLGTRFLLGGTVRRDATTAKVSARLVDANTGQQVWGQTFKHSLAAADLIETQEKIAASVVAAIGGEYGIITRRLAAESRTKRPAELSTYDAMLRYYSYQIAPSPKASKACFRALQDAVVREPEYGPAWSALATLFCQMHTFDAPGFDDPLATGLSYAKRGVILEPERQLSRLILAYALLLGDSLDAFRVEAETVLSLNPNNPYAVGAIGYMHVLTGDFERGRTLLDQATAAGPVAPHWFSHGYYLERFRDGDYEGALNSLNAPSDQDVWMPALLAAALGKLGRREEAGVPRTRLEAWKPDFDRRARELIGRSIKTPELVDDLLDGLRKAGVPIEDG